VIAAGNSGQAWVFASSINDPLLPPLIPLESAGNAAVFRVNSNGLVDRVARIGGNPLNNSAYASMPVSEGGVLAQSNGNAVLAGSIAPTLSSELLASEFYDLPLAQSPNTALPSTIRDALPLATCGGSACSGSAGVFAQLTPDASAAQLALSLDNHPNLTLRNLGTADATGLAILSDGYTHSSDCGQTLAAGAECSIVLAGTASGSITVQASNFAAFTTPLPATTGIADSIAVLPHALNFGIVTSASLPATQTLSIHNFANTTQTFASQRVSTIPAGYTLTQSSSTCTPAGDGLHLTIAANATCTVTLSLKASSNAAQDGPILATWQAGPTDIAITGYTQAAAVSLSSQLIDFGRQYLNGIRAPRYLYLSNASASPQTHATVVSTNPVFTLTDECPTTLQPHSVCRMGLGYLSLTAPSSDALSLNVDGTSVTVLGETLPPPTIDSANINPNLTVSTQTLAFADPVTVTTPSVTVQTVRLSNIGTIAFPLQLSVTGDFAYDTSCPVSLPGGSSCNVNVTFTPSSPGMRQGLLSVVAGLAGPVYITLSGTGTAVLPANNGLTFGDVPLHTPVVQWLKVSQAFTSMIAASSDSSYQVILVEDTGYGHGQPAASNFASTATGSCLSCWLGVQFTPTATGANLASILLGSSITGKPTSLSVSGNGIPLTGLLLTPVSEDYGPIAVHTTSAATLFQLTNATGSSITATNATLTGDFVATSETSGGNACTGTMLDAGASCFVPVQFAPTATGTRSGQLTLATSAGNTSATLTGTGSPDPGISFSPGELRFDNVPGTDATQQTITLTNTGSGIETIGTPLTSDSHFISATDCTTLSPAATCTITVIYTPSAQLSSGILTVPVASNTAGTASASTYAIALSGLYTSESAGLQIIPGEHSTVHFGSVPTGHQSDARLLHVNNLGDQPLNLSVTAPRQFTITDSNCATLAANGSCDLAVRFTPLTAGDITGTLFLQGTPTDGSTTVTGLGYLEGYGTGRGTVSLTGNLSIQGTLNFGQLASGQSLSQTITLTNPVNAAAGSSVTIRRIQSSAPFLTTTDCGQPLAPGESCTLTVTYAPVYQVTANAETTTPRVDTSTITIETNTLNAPLFVDLSGQVTPVNAAASVNGEPLKTFSLSQGSLYFTGAAVGTASAAQTVQITNTGNASIHIQQFIPSQGFAATSDNCALLQPATSCNIFIEFRPQTSGTTSGSLQILSDAVSSLDFVSLTGASGISSAELMPQALSFGRVLVGSSSTQTAILSNTGTTRITFGDILATSNFALATASTQGNLCIPKGALDAGENCNIPVVFRPSTTGTLRGSLAVTTSATQIPLTVALSGVGVQPQLAVSSPILTFGNIMLGSSATLSLTLSNTGTAPLDGLTFAATGNFSVASNCGLTTINANSSCAISVTFMPTVLGPASGTLTIASTDPASPLLVSLAGTAVPDDNNGNGSNTGSFTLTVNGASSATASVQQGVSATYTLGITPVDGYAGTVALTCTPDTVVSYATCSVLPSTVILTSGIQSSTATITTVTTLSTTTPLSTNNERRKAVLSLLPAGLLLYCLRRRKAAALLCSIFLVFGIFGCGSGSNADLRFTSVGTYGFHITASSTNGTSTSQTVALTLDVRPGN